jgi:hypothetical protein
VLSDYIANAKGRMVSSMYEFHAEHVADAIQERLENGIKMDLALDNATRVTRAGVGDGDFNRKTVFRKWARDFSFDRIYVPEGPNGLIADSYHIKVTVDDNDRLWLSSGNWKNSSQPNIEPADLNNLRAIRAKKGNREWHVVIKNKTLATRYRSHILADLEFSKENGGTEEAVVDDVLVDVPIAIEESVAFETGSACGIAHLRSDHNRPPRQGEAAADARQEGQSLYRCRAGSHRIRGRRTVVPDSLHQLLQGQRHRQSRKTGGGAHQKVERDQYRAGHPALGPRHLDSLR